VTPFASRPALAAWMSSTWKATWLAPTLCDNSGRRVSDGGLRYSSNSSMVSPSRRHTCLSAAPGTPTPSPSSGPSNQALGSVQISRPSRSW
jgi:hypothetical protein